MGKSLSVTFTSPVTPVPQWGILTAIQDLRPAYKDITPVKYATPLLTP